VPRMGIQLRLSNEHDERRTHDCVRRKFEIAPMGAPTDAGEHARDLAAVGLSGLGRSISANDDEHPSQHPWPFTLCRMTKVSV